MALRLLVGIRFQVLFTPLAGVLFTFPSRYLFTIGRQLVFSLAKWSSRIPAGFLVPRGTQGTTRSFPVFAYAAITLFGRVFQPGSANGTTSMLWPYDPQGTLRNPGFRLFRFRSPLLSESLLFSFPPGTEMVHFPGFASPTYLFSRRYTEFVSVGFPIRKSPDQSLFAAPRSLSQLTTSFIACWRQGIHRTPLVA
jgi:hypothetical protein